MSGDSRIIAEVVPDVTGIDRTFDYSIPEELEATAIVGSRVRIDLNGRRIPGWIVSLHDERAGRDGGEVGTGAEIPVAASTSRLELKPILETIGIGPDADLIELCRWAAWRWCVPRLRPFLVSASAHRNVARANPMRRSVVLAEPTSPAASALLADGGGVLRLPPTVDQLPAILSAARLGPILVVCATVDSSRIFAARLRRAGLTTALVPDEWAAARGGVDVTIGARSAALAPCPDPAAAVLVDEHEESLQEERMPTWHARDLLDERCRRLGIPFLIVSPCPTVVASHGRRVLAPPPERERSAWPSVEVVDQGEEAPWNRSLLSAPLLSVCRDTELRVGCVINTKGMARLLGCRQCSALVRCERCQGAMSEMDEGHLDCAICGSTRPRVCAACGSSTLARLRPGVTRLRDELEKAANRTVGHIASDTSDVDDATHDLFIGTTALLHRVRRLDVVAFLDFDRELLAPRFRAHEQAMALLVTAARLVGPRSQGGRILLQTTLADHDVVRSAVEGNGAIFADSESKRRQSLGLPPFSALAVVEGDGIAECLEGLRGRAGLVVSRYRETILVRATDHQTLCQAWSALPVEVRSNVRIEVDPLSV